MTVLRGWLSIGAALLALLFITVACEDPNAPGAKPPPQPTEPVDPPKKSYLGTVKATVRTAGGTRMQGTLSIEDDGAFRLSTLTTASTASASVRRLQPAADDNTGTAPVLVALGGTSSDDGTTATLAVQSGSVAGVKLEGAQLAKYQQCAIAGTIGAGFHAEVLAAAASCVLASGDVPAVGDTGVTPNDVTVALVAPDVKPIDALLGSWGALFDSTTEVAGIAVVWEFSENRLVTRYFNSVEETWLEYGDLVVTSEAIVELTLAACSTACTNLIVVQEMIQETLPWSYVLTGDVLTVGEPLFKEVGSSFLLELQRDYEPEPPVRVPRLRGFSDMDLAVGEVRKVDLTYDPSTSFYDPYDPSTKTYSASSSNSAAVRASVSGAELTLTGAAAGGATVTVTAVEANGATASRSFEVVVFANDPRAVDALVGRWGGLTYRENDPTGGPSAATIWEFTRSGLRIRYYNTVGVVVYEYDDLLVAAGKIRDLTAVSVALCLDGEGADCDPKPLDDEEVVAWFEGISYSLPWSYELSGDVLTMRDTHYLTLPRTYSGGGDVGDFELRRNHEPEPPTPFWPEVPKRLKDIPDVEFASTSDDPVTVNLTEYFTGGEYYSVGSSRSDVVSASVVDQGEIVTLTPLDVGESTITAWASNEAGSTYQEFVVKVVTR